MKKVYVPFRYIHIIQQIFTKNNKQTIRIKHLFWKIFVQVAQKEEIYINAIILKFLQKCKPNCGVAGDYVLLGAKSTKNAGVSISPYP